MEPTAPTNPYAAPRAELDVAPPSIGLPANIAGAVEGKYDFTVSEVMDEAWKLTKGMKGAFWGAAIVIGLIYFVVLMIGGVVIGLLMDTPNAVVQQVFNAIVGTLLAPLVMGLEMMCVRRALGQPISFSTAFSYFPKAGTAIAAALLTTLFTYLGLLLLIIPAIYLGVGYSLTMQLIGDRDLSAGDAMKTSRRAIKHKWWGVFGLFTLVGLITGSSAMLLLIPLIWTMPWMMMTTAVLYRRIFYAPVAAAAPAAAVGPPTVAPAP